MIATFFEWKVRKGMEDEFRAGWNEATAAYLEKGSLGSSLWLAESGHFCAFALWPDRETRARAFAAEDSRERFEGMAPLVETVVSKVDCDLLDMHWKFEAIDR